MNDQHLREGAAPPHSVVHEARILIVDDDRDNRVVLKRFLIAEGFETLEAEGGEQALSIATFQAPDAVLLDVIMPGMDGITVLSSMKADPALAQIPVIMLSALDDMKSVITSLKMGAEDHLTKPFNRVLLRIRLSAVLDRKRLLDREVKNKQALAAALLLAEAEREKAQQLLLNILPLGVSQELLSSGSVAPSYFADVTIGFADVVGFSIASERLPADEIVRNLNGYFSAMDRVIRNYGLEKIKTIGDSYMFVGGLPSPSTSHGVDMVLAAIDMLAIGPALQVHGFERWDLRIGLHTGPVIAGVVGTHKFSYDIWGEAVNLAARLESSGTPQDISMSAQTHARVRDFFRCSKAGSVTPWRDREIERFVLEKPDELSTLNVELVRAAYRTETFTRRYNTYFRRQLPPLEVLE